MADPGTIAIVVGLLVLALVLSGSVRVRRRRGKGKYHRGLSRRFSRKLEPNAAERKRRDEQQLIRDIEAHERATGETSMVIPNPNAHKKRRN